MMATAQPLENSADEIGHWIDAYADGELVNKAEIFAALADAVAPVLPGFRYLKSQSTFRAECSAATQYVTLERGHRIVSLRFGLTHAEVERVRAELYGAPRYIPKSSPRTISKYTANMGPRHAGWPHPTRAQWPIIGADGLARAKTEVPIFVAETALPYLIAHHDPATIRETYVLTPRRADQVPSEEIVFAIDVLLGRPDWLQEDKEALLHRCATDEQRQRVVLAHSVAAAWRQNAA